MVKRTVGELADGDSREWLHDGWKHRRQAASIRELSIQDRVAFFQFATKFVGDHFKAGAQRLGVELQVLGAVQPAALLEPP